MPIAELPKQDDRTTNIYPITSGLLISTPSEMLSMTISFPSGGGAEVFAESETVKSLY